jgi:hypothetical protein
MQKVPLLRLLCFQTKLDDLIAEKVTLGTGEAWREKNSVTTFVVEITAPFTHKNKN